MNLDETSNPSRREGIAIALMTLIGGCLRIWPMGRLGLNHFDEGIYAITGAWSLSPKGIASLDPTLIAYAPPGYPILGGLAYAILGRSDAAMILVSQIAGTLTIPIIAWLARRTFGAGAGYASAVVCAFSGPHLAFSRMGLTDSSALLVWLIALGAGMRFLERPGLFRALLMGLAVGLAQEFKYNGWLSGGIVIATALVGVVVRPDARKPGSIGKTFGWGGCAVGIAWLVVWPWYRFVEAHGSYSALLRHQQSYLGGFPAWWPNLLVQADQAVALSGGLGLTIPTLGFLIATPWIVRTPNWSRAFRDFGWRRLGLTVSIVAIFSGYLVNKPYWLGLISLPWLLIHSKPSVRLVGVWFLVLGATSPFYHAYARLWLPLEATHWILLGWFVAEGPGLARMVELSSIQGSWGFRRARWLGALVLGLGGLAAWIDSQSTLVRGATPQPGLLAPSDSLKEASHQILALLPQEVRGLQLLVRPPLTYYLAGRIALYPLPGSEGLSKPGNPKIWMLVDSSILRSELGQGTESASRTLLDRLAGRWEVVEEISTTLSLPTLLDLDPNSALSTQADRTCRLWLLRPRRSEAQR